MSRLVPWAVLALVVPGAAAAEPAPWDDAFACAAALELAVDLAEQAPGLAAPHVRGPEGEAALRRLNRALEEAAPVLARMELAGHATAESALQAAYPAWTDARRSSGRTPVSLDSLRAEARAAAMARVDAVNALPGSDALPRFITDLDCMGRMGPEMDRLAAE